MAKKNSKQAAKTTQRAKPAVRQTTGSAPPAKGSTLESDDVTTEARSERAGPPVVGIGASAGGLDAFKGFFAAMPADSGLAFVLIPHLDPKHESLMVELLTRCTTMQVVEAADGMAVEANHVYVIPPNKYLTMSDGTLRLTGPVERGGPQTSIDLFFRSLANDKQEKAVCIILSGTGSHGSLGLKAVKAAGGMAMVQDPKTAESRGMPESAIATGQVDYVLPVGKMPEALLQYIQHYCGNEVKTGEEGTEGADHLNQVMELLRANTKIDFRYYRKSMFVRRIERRMSLGHFHQMADYVTFLRTHPAEFHQLFRDLLISVTTFFRDPQAFQTLETEVIAPLIRTKGPDSPVRVWSAGCATGEEPYSVGMLLLEQLAAAQKSCHVQVFATDVDEAALDTARQGIYPENIATDVSPDRLAQFFTRATDGRYHVSKALREIVVFARQSLITDAPFSKLDLIVCRNVLIYLEPEVQKKVLALLHFSLNEGGALFLGPSETIGRHTDLFEPVSQKHCIFRRIGPARPERVEVPITALVGPLNPARHLMPATTIQPVNFAEMTRRLLLDEFAPPALLINRNYEILYFFGDTDSYLAFSTGEPTRDLMLLARPGLQTKLRSAIHKTLQENGPVSLATRIKRKDGNHPVIVTIRPVQNPQGKEGKDGLLLVTFQDGAQDQMPSHASESAEEESAVRQLEGELKATREDFQSAIEELASSNEQLKVSNEEAMSMNEELQSANEELETSKEELQSLNEELSTVNNQLQDKLAELETANNDLANLLRCTEVGIVFLDNEFRIQRFTHPATRLLNLISTDLRRPISHITPKFPDSTLPQDIEQALRTSTPHEKQVQTPDGCWWNLRISLYRTLDNRIDGIVLTFTDVTQVRQADELTRRLATVLRDSNDAVYVHDFNGKISAWNRGAKQMFGYSEAEVLRMNAEQLVPEQERDRVRSFWEQLRRGKSVQSWETQRRTVEGRILDVCVTATALFDEMGQPIAIAKTERDITEQKRVHTQLEKEVEQRTAALRKSQEELATILQTAADAIITIDLKGIVQSVNAAAGQMFGYLTTEMIGQNVKILMPPPFRDEHDGYLEHYHQTGVAKIIGIGREVVAQRKDGSVFPVELAVSNVDHLDLFTGILRDISRRKELEREVLEIASLEQQRIGQDLHDSVGQEVTALNILVGDLAETAHTDPSHATLTINRMVKGLHRCQDELRTVMRGLMPVAVDSEGLMAALSDLAEDTSKKWNVTCKFDCPEPVAVTDNLSATHLFLIAQEAVHNAIKHGKPRNVQISLEKNHTLLLSVRDDGIGMPTQPTDSKGGLGLRIMRNRATIIGALLTVQSAEPTGTIIQCALVRMNRETKPEKQTR